MCKCCERSEDLGHCLHGADLATVVLTTGYIHLYSIYVILSIHHHIILSIQHSCHPVYPVFRSSCLSSIPVILCLQYSGHPVYPAFRSPSVSSIPVILCLQHSGHPVYPVFRSSSVSSILVILSIQHSGHPVYPAFRSSSVSSIPVILSIQHSGHHLCPAFRSKSLSSISVKLSVQHFSHTLYQTLLSPSLMAFTSFLSSHHRTFHLPFTQSLKFAGLREPVLEASTGGDATGAVTQLPVVPVPLLPLDRQRGVLPRILPQTVNAGKSETKAKDWSFIRRARATSLVGSCRPRKMPGLCLLSKQVSAYTMVNIQQMAFVRHSRMLASSKDRSVVPYHVIRTVIR